MNYDQIIDKILDENNFTVGGGSSAAIAGAFACGLIAMVANLSKGKNYGHSDEEYEKMMKELKMMKDQLLQGSVDDHQAYLLIANAYKMPKITEEEKKSRSMAIENAGVEAAKVPLSNANWNKRVLEIGRDLLNQSNPSCLSDLQAGILFASIGLEIAIENVKANLPLIKNEQLVDNFNQKLQSFNEYI